MDNIISAEYYTYFLIFFALLLPLLLSFRMFPVIIYLVNIKNLMDEPGHRSTHIQKTPTLGGLGIFIAFSLTLIVMGLGSNFSQEDLVKLLSLNSGGILLLFAGIKDDLVGLAPKKKMLVQLIAATIVILYTDVRIRSFYGVFGIEELPLMVSVLLTILAFVFMINAINLIDGIDGLAGTFGIVASLTFGLYYVINERYLMILVSFILIGTLLGFLRYNFSKDRKIFMGDSGSMFLGFLIVYQAIGFLWINTLPTTEFKVGNAPILFLAILSFPIVDTLRVFSIRIKQKRSPFSADRNHIHHRLLDLGFTHKQATALLGLATILVIGSAFMMESLPLTVQLGMLILVILMVYLSPWILVRKTKTSLAVFKKVEEVVTSNQQKLNVPLFRAEIGPLNTPLNPKFEKNNQFTKELREIDVEIVEVQHAQMEKAFDHRIASYQKFKKVK